MRIALIACSCLLLAVAGSRSQTPPNAEVSPPAVGDQARLETILARFDAAQIAIQTLAADFTERKDLALLKEPVRSTGHFYYARPDQAKWEYGAPDQRVFLISEDTLQQYFPDRKLLEKKDLRAANISRVFKLFGMGQSSRDLRTFYDISLGDPSDVPGTYLLVLTPRRKAVEKRLARVLLYVGDQDFLPRAMTWEEADGDRTHLEFTNVRVNGELASNTFELKVPADVRVEDQISLFSPPKGSPR